MVLLCVSVFVGCLGVVFCAHTGCSPPGICVCVGREREGKQKNTQRGKGGRRTRDTKHHVDWWVMVPVAMCVGGVVIAFVLASSAATKSAAKSVKEECH